MGRFLQNKDALTNKKKGVNMDKMFRCKADFRFPAKSIDDAFRQLSDHFECLSSEKESPLLLVGEIHIEPERKET